MAETRSFVPSLNVQRNLQSSADAVNGSECDLLANFSVDYILIFVAASIWTSTIARISASSLDVTKYKVSPIPEDFSVIKGKFTRRTNPLAKSCIVLIRTATGASRSPLLEEKT